MSTQASERERDRPVPTVTLAQVEAPASSGHTVLHFSPWELGHGADGLGSGGLRRVGGSLDGSAYVG